MYNFFLPCLFYFLFLNEMCVHENFLNHGNVDLWQRSLEIQLFFFVSTKQSFKVLLYWVCVYLCCCCNLIFFYHYPLTHKVSHRATPTVHSTVENGTCFKSCFGKIFKVFLFVLKVLIVFPESAHYFMKKK